MEFIENQSMTDCFKALRRVYKDVIDTDRSIRHYQCLKNQIFILSVLKKLCRMNRQFQDELRYANVLPFMIEASELFVASARRDIKIKSDYQEELNQYVQLLLGFFNNFIFQNKKNQVRLYLVELIEICVPQGVWERGTDEGLPTACWPRE